MAVWRRVKVTYVVDEDVARRDAGRTPRAWIGATPRWSRRPSAPYLGLGLLDELWAAAAELPPVTLDDVVAEQHAARAEQRHPAPGLVQVVADPNVLVSAAVTPIGACAQLLSKLLESPLEIVASPLLLDEVERVLRRPRFDLSLPALRASLRRVPPSDRARRGGSSAPRSTPRRCRPGRRLSRSARRSPAAGACSSRGDRHLLDLAGEYPIVSPRELLDRLA